MIAQITGRVVTRSATWCVIDVAGVGLRVSMSTRALAGLPVSGDSVTVYTHLHVREDELSLFGFESVEEQDLFERLITVSGIGPKVALSALSAFSPADLAAAIAGEDDALIATIPGIGKKTAQRMIVELKDALAAAGSGGTRSAAAAGARAEASDALASMGFAPAEVAAALKGYDGPDEAGALLRHALKRLGGA